jgi:hypothetical protein
MIYGKLFLKPTIKSLSGKKRNWAKVHGLVLTGRNKNNAHECLIWLTLLKRKIYEGWRLVKAKKIGSRSVKKMMKLHNLLKWKLVTEMMVPIDVKNCRMEEKRRGPSATIDGWTELSIPEDLRVYRREDLWRLFRGFRFPDKFVAKGRNVFSGEEVFLFGLYRLSHCGKYCQYDVQELFGFYNTGIAS